jgi:hypothetical protein
VTLLPLFVGLSFLGGKNRLPALVGIVSGIFIIVTSRSSGALLAMGTVVLGFALWRLRTKMRLLRIGAVLTILLLALVMKAPVWYLIGRLSGIVGGTGWHRSYLIDQFVYHFNEWWFAGTTYTAHWAPGGQVLEVDPNNMDITNQYVKEGVDGGLAKLALFIAMIVVSYKTVGSAIRRANSFAARFFIWSIGICLSAHCVSFLSISYFDQIVVMWYWLLAVISMVAIAAKGRVTSPVPAVARAKAGYSFGNSHCQAPA